MELTTSSLTTATAETGGVHGGESLKEEYTEEEESVELTTSSLTTGTAETGGVHGGERLKEESQGRRRRKSVRERVEEIERGDGVVTSSRERLMSDRKIKFEKIDLKEQKLVEKRMEAKKKRDEKKIGGKVENEIEEDRRSHRRQLTVREMMEIQLVGRKITKEKQ